MADNTRSKQLLKENALMETEESIGDRLTNLEEYMVTQTRQFAEILEKMRISNAENSYDHNRSRLIYTEPRDSPMDLDYQACEERFEDIFDDPIVALKQLQ
ncbi:unnamed protein product [Cochlearia groenlandica]